MEIFYCRSCIESRRLTPEGQTFLLRVFIYFSEKDLLEEQDTWHTLAPKHQDTVIGPSDRSSCLHPCVEGEVV